MAILGVSSVIDEIRKLSGNVRPALDARINGLVASFEAISPDSRFDDVSIRRKIRTLAYDIVRRPRSVALGVDLLTLYRRTFARS